MKLIKTKLYGEPKGGKVKEWWVEVDNNKIIVSWCREGGKIQTKETQCTGKNIGRSNETTPKQQAELEAISKWSKQVDKYYYENKEEALKSSTQGVMLAHDYLKNSHKIDYEFHASRKLDGLRCKSVYRDGMITFYSRGNKTYEVPQHIEKDLIKIHENLGYEQLDGELYCHGMSLQKINSATKKHNQDTSGLEYHIFDIPLEDVVWDKRYVQLQGISNYIKNWDFKAVTVVENEFCTKDNLDTLQHKYRSEGYEGVMLRNFKGKYEFKNKRSSDLQKYKLFQDSEALVINCREDKNNEGVLLCKWNNVTFECKMKGDHKFRNFNNQKTLINNWINFTYQDVSDEGVPIFPVGQYIRDCNMKGEPNE